MAYETHKNSQRHSCTYLQMYLHTHTRTHTYGYIHINNHWTLNKKAPEEEVDMRKDEHEDVDVEVEVPENFPIKCRQFYKPPNSKTTTTTTNCGATNASHWVCNKNQALFFSAFPYLRGSAVAVEVSVRFTIKWRQILQPGMVKLKYGYKETFRFTNTAM